MNCGTTGVGSGAGALLPGFTAAEMLGKYMETFLGLLCVPEKSTVVFETQASEGARQINSEAI